MKKLTTIIIASLILMSSAYASLEPKVEHFTKSVYGAGPQNWGVAQQQNGIMYFANMNGLLSYDGLSWKLQYIPGTGNNVRSIFIDSDGSIYVGAYNEFGVFRADENGLKEYFSISSLLQGDERNFNEIWNICKTESGIIFQSYSSIMIYDGQKVTELATPVKIKYSTAINNTFYITSDTDGVYVLAGTRFMPLPNNEVLRNKTITSLIEIDEKKLLIITLKHGIYLYNDGQITQNDEEYNRILINDQAFCARKDGNILAIGTIRNGIMFINLTTNQYKTINTDNGLQNNTVLNINFDNDGNVWLGLDNGIDCVKIENPFKDIFPANKSYGMGYCSIMKGNILYLGTNQGVFAAKYKDGEIGNIEVVEGTQGQVYNLVSIDSHLFCCHHNGMYEINGTFSKKIANIEGIWTAQRLKSDPNYIIAGYYFGFILLHKEDGDWKYVGKVAGFEESSRIFEQDEQGNIWMSHGLLGVYKLTLSDDKQSFSKVAYYGRNKGFAHHEHISAFMIDSDIVFAAEDGIYRYDEKSDMMKIDRETSDNLLGDGQYYYINEDKYGRLWYLKSNRIGIAVKNREDGIFHDQIDKGFSIEHDLVYEYFRINVINEDYIVVTNEDGFTLVDLNSLDNDKLPDVYVRKIYSTKDKQTLASQYIKSSTDEPTLSVDYKTNSLGFEYSMTSLMSGKKNHVIYFTKLNGYDRDWSEPSNATTKEYFDLHEGIYTFEVKCIDSNNNESYTSYTFEIRAPWYRTIWAFLLYLVVIILIGFAIWKYTILVQKRAEAKNRRMLEEQQKQYEQEAEKKEKEIIILKNEQLESDVAHKSNELASSTMNLMRKNEVLIEVRDDINKIISNLPSNEEGKSTGRKLSKLVQSINANIEHDDDWKKFEENFDAIHGDFMRRLAEQYKGLTVSDKKLCAYLKMNLVSKEIAPLLNISVRGVEIGRYRLRKKLNLDRDTNLTDFLQNF